MLPGRAGHMAIWLEIEIQPIGCDLFYVVPVTRLVLCTNHLMPSDTSLRSVKLLQKFFFCLFFLVLHKERLMHFLYFFFWFVLKCFLKERNTDFIKTDLCCYDLLLPLSLVWIILFIQTFKNLCFLEFSGNSSGSFMIQMFPMQWLHQWKCGHAELIYCKMESQ